MSCRTVQDLFGLLDIPGVYGSLKCSVVSLILKDSSTVGVRNVEDQGAISKAIDYMIED